MKWNEFTTWKSTLKSSLRWLGIVLAIHLIFLAIYKIMQSWDNDPDRGAFVFNNSDFNDEYSKIFSGKIYDENKKKKINWQGWSVADSMWFYTTTQGSDLIPYDFFLVLEEKGSEKRFNSPERMNGYRYIVLKKTFSNPEGLPLGIVKDVYQGKEYIGFTCAACHTAQINYNKIAMRVDGAPAMSDMESFIEDLSAALNETGENEAKKKRFIEAVMARNGFLKMFTGGRNYTSKVEVEEDLKKFSSRLMVYKTINKSRIDDNKERLKYGFARLDAFGRIFNRTVQHILTRSNLETVLREYLEPAELKNVLKKVNEEILSNNEFDHLLDRLVPLLTEKELLLVSKKLFNSPNAPVSYPYLWDAPQHDYLQTNGIAANAGLGPLARNTGEVIGVFGTLDWQEQESITLNSLLLGNKNKKISFDSSIDAFNLVRLENKLKNLYSPLWPEEILGKIDGESARGHSKRGEKLFDEYCESCHHSIERTRHDRKVVASFTNLEDSGTDTKMALNALTRTGYSGILYESYSDSNVGSLVMQEKVPVALSFLSVTKQVIATPDPDKWFIRRWYEMGYNYLATLLDNDIQPSLRMGNYKASNEAAPFNELLAYKSRPLNGIWATAPYLHNGSVPTLYDLLLPSKKDVASGKVKPVAGGQYRPETFLVGSREFDPEKVGFITTGYKGFKFDTSKKGNMNTGHIYHMNEMSEQDRWDLVEYLKTL